MDELLQIAIAAYRANKFHDAVELLVQITCENSSHEMARFYLAMAYEKDGCVGDAHRLFQQLTSSSDEHIRARAGTILPLIEAKMRRVFQKDTAKADVRKDDRADSDKALIDAASS